VTDVSNRIVQKLWSYCNVLRDDVLSYQDYLEQLTFLLFLKMADERAALTGHAQSIPRGYRWGDLASPQMGGVKLEQHYRDTLVYDLRTNKHFTLKTKRMTRADLDEFVACYKPGERQKRKATWSGKNPEGRWRPFTYDEIVARDKVSLDLFWLRDESLEDSANLPDPHILAQEIADDLRSALGQIEDILGDLERRVTADDTTPRGA
jgi:hypothetical protein